MNKFVFHTSLNLQDPHVNVDELVYNQALEGFVSLEQWTEHSHEQREE